MAHRIVNYNTGIKVVKVGRTGRFRVVTNTILFIVIHLHNVCTFLLYVVISLFCSVCLHSYLHLKERCYHSLRSCILEHKVY